MKTKQVRPQRRLLGGESAVEGDRITPLLFLLSGRPLTAWMDNIKTWTGLSVDELIGMTEDRDKWRKYVHGVANPRSEDG